MSTSAISRRPRASRPEPTLRYGDRLSKYLINGFAGVGATSYVYRARTLDSFQPVAVKVLHPHLIEDQVKRLRFEREAQMMMRFSHPNVVQFHEIIELADGGLAFVMEYIDGQTLEDWLQTDEAKSVAESTIACLFVDVLRGLNHAHRFGVIHRDLKPANILITQTADRFVAKIIDFGVARFADQPTPPEDKQKIVGTAAYISPEEVRDPDTVCASSDLYSIGVMMFEAACGVRPFEGKPVRELMDAHAYEAPPRPREVNPAITPALESVIMRTLAKTPNERFDSAPQMITALEMAIRSAMHVAAQLEAPAPAVTARTTEWRRDEPSAEEIALATSNDAARFLALCRQAMLMAFTLLMTSGAEGRDGDPHHLNRAHDFHLPLR